MTASEVDPMLTKLTSLAFGLVQTIDAGKHIAVPPREMIGQIEDGTVFVFLANYKEIADTSLARLTEGDKRRLLGEWQNMANAIDASREFGIDNNGLCLLLAYVIEGIQERAVSGRP